MTEHARHRREDGSGKQGTRIRIQSSLIIGTQPTKLTSSHSSSLRFINRMRGLSLRGDGEHRRRTSMTSGSAQDFFPAASNVDRGASITVSLSDPKMDVSSPSALPSASENGRGRKLVNGRLAEEYYEPFPPNHFAPGANHQKLQVGIVGAGIAGLTAAVALLQSGHDVEVRWSRHNAQRCYADSYRPIDVRKVPILERDWSGHTNVPQCHKNPLLL